MGDSGAAREREAGVVTFTICPTGKKTFGTRKDAKLFKRRSRGLHRDRLGVYQCDDCGFFHLGHTPKGFYERKAA